MTARCILAAAFDFATIGSAAYTLTDSAGAHPTFTFSSGVYEHGSICSDAGVASPSISSFVTAFVAALNAASPTKTYSGSWSTTTGLYTISVNSGTFSIATSGVDAYHLLGASGSPFASTGTTYTSPLVPKFAILPAKPGLTAYLQPTRATGYTKERKTSAGSVRRSKPTSIGREASWEHHFEPKYMVDRDAYFTASATQIYTWEDLWDDYGLAKVPIGMRVEDVAGNYEQLAFSLIEPDYSAGVVKRRAPSDDARFVVSVKARLWRAATANTYARSFNA